MCLMTSKFQSLAHLANFVPPSSHCLPLEPTTVVPLEIVDLDEGKTDNNIAILEAFQRDTKKPDGVCMVSEQTYNNSENLSHKKY